MYKFPFSCIFPLGITSSLIGIAEGALACNMAAQRERVTVSGVPIKEDPYVLFAIGEAAAEIAASRAAILETVDRFWDMTEKGQEVSFELRAIGRRTQTAAAWRAVRAVDEIFARSGGGALQLSTPMQRFWRDAHCRSRARDPCAWLHFPCVDALAARRRTAGYPPGNDLNQLGRTSAAGSLRGTAALVLLSVGGYDVGSIRIRFSRLAQSFN